MNQAQARELLVQLRDRQREVRLIFRWDRWGPGRDPELEELQDEFFSLMGRYANIDGVDPLDN